jgi:RNA recognition motif-containing protein
VVCPIARLQPSTPYCFVDLNHSEDGDTVIEKLRGHLIRGRSIKINYDTGKRAEHHPRRLETRMANGERRSFDFNSTSTSRFVFDRYARTDTREHWTKPIGEGRRLIV